MSDPRELKSNGRVAHISLRGQVEAERFARGETKAAAAPIVGIHDAGRALQRELLLHDPFVVLEECDGWAFGFGARDGYVGYVWAEVLAPALWEPTHVISAPASYVIGSPKLTHGEEITPISLGTELHVFATHEGDRWAEVSVLRAPGDVDGHKRDWCSYVPLAHLRPIGEPESDPVAVAERLLGVPYHWGGNSSQGTDCAGLVQMACRACGIDAPADSDQQMVLGAPATGAPRRGDLLFWKGHVAWVADADRIIHANGTHMAVVYEGRDAAIERIMAKGEGPVVAHRRL